MKEPYKMTKEEWKNEYVIFTGYFFNCKFELWKIRKKQRNKY